MEHLSLPQAGKTLAAQGAVTAGLSVARKEVATAPLDTIELADRWVRSPGEQPGGAQRCWEAAQLWPPAQQSQSSAAKGSTHDQRTAG